MTTRQEQIDAAQSRYRQRTQAPTKPAGRQAAQGEPKKGEALAYYDSSRGVYWTKNSGAGWIQFTEGALKRRLRLEKFSDIQEKEIVAIKTDKELLRMQLENDVCYAGGIAGYKPGIHEICGQRILVTEGPRLIAWKPGRWDNIRSLITQLLGDQANVVYAWLKCALRSLYSGPPFRPGQMLALAGQAGGGKSLFQNLLTEAFGGRSAKPYRYLIGDTTFNSDLLRAEHLMVEDDASSTDHRSRKSFGTMLKNLIVNETQSLHRKGRDAIMVTPFTRLTITLNDEPENLMVLPPFEDSLKDKIILLRAHKAKFPYESDDLAGRHRYRQCLTNELPAFIEFVRSYRIPDRLKNQRYGVSAYHDPELLKDLRELSPEWKLLSLIDSLNIWEFGCDDWEGTAADLEDKLRSKDKSGMVRDLLSFSTACGVFLKAIATSLPTRVSARRVHGGSRVWTIKKPV